MKPYRFSLILNLAIAMISIAGVYILDSDGVKLLFVGFLIASINGAITSYWYAGIGKSPSIFSSKVVGIVTVVLYFFRACGVFICLWLIGKNSYDLSEFTDFINKITGFASPMRSDMAAVGLVAMGYGLALMCVSAILSAKHILITNKNASIDGKNSDS